MSGAQAEFTNNSGLEVTWELTWGRNGSASGDFDPGDPPVQITLRPNMDQAGFTLSNFTGRVVVEIANTGGYTPNMVASSDPDADPGTVQDGTALQWTNYCSGQTVNWVIVSGSSAVQGEMPPGGAPVTQILAADVTAVGFQLSAFSGSVSSVFGSTTLTAELQVQDEDNVKRLRAIRK